jgi:6-phosphofructokinase
MADKRKAPEGAYIQRAVTTMALDVVQCTTMGRDTVQALVRKNERVSPGRPSGL